MFISRASKMLFAVVTLAAALPLLGVASAGAAPVTPQKDGPREAFGAVPLEDGDDGTDDDDDMPPEALSKGITTDINCGEILGRRIARLPDPKIDLVVGVADKCTGSDSEILFFKKGKTEPEKRCVVPDASSGECRFTVEVGDRFRVVCNGEGGGKCTVTRRGFKVQ